MFNKLICIFLFLCPSFAQGTPDISLQLQRFNSATSPYIEVSLYVVGSSLICSTMLDYGVEYMLLIKDEQGNIVLGNHYRLSNHGCPSKDLIDVKRYNLTQGTYSIEVEMNDILDTINVINVNQSFVIDGEGPQSRLSDVQLLSTVHGDDNGTSPLHKSGLYFEPLPFRYYYPALDFLNLYVETYHADRLEGQPYLRYTIKPTIGNIPAPVIAYRKVKKEPITSNVFQLDIKNLISGHYSLETTLFDGNKIELASRSVDFSRDNPAGDSLYVKSGALDLSTSFVNEIPEDSIDYFLKAMAPVVNSEQVEIMNALLVKGSLKAKQFFIHQYWIEQAGKYAQNAFDSYMKVARVVDENFRSGFGYGFETDRGHIFLKYGKPDDTREVEDEPSAPPYEIWYYTTFPATHQNNVRFLFYNPSLSRNGFKLLHSTAIGEVKNEKWEVELYRDATLETPGVNERQMGDNVYRNARKYFEN